VLKEGQSQPLTPAAALNKGNTPTWGRIREVITALRELLGGTSKLRQAEYAA
jgi:hypothetical protein